jgi:hypothetical protein
MSSRCHFAARCPRHLSVLSLRCVADSSLELAPLPLGFERFHRRDSVNYQLNGPTLWDLLTAKNCMLRQRG